MSPPVPPFEFHVVGCHIDACDAETCARYLTWLLGSSTGDVPERYEAKDLRWALAHCDDGVTWGRYDTSQARWWLGSEVAPGVSPVIRRETLQELRIFGKHREVLIWRTDMGLRGRILRETDPETDRKDKSNPLRPSDEVRILRGNDLHRGNQAGTGFTRITDRTGAEQVVPVTVTSEDFESRRRHSQPLGLRVRHYYAEEPATGAVGIVATRLVWLHHPGDPP